MAISHADARPSGDDTSAEIAENAGAARRHVVRNEAGIVEGGAGMPGPSATISSVVVVPAGGAA